MAFPNVSLLAITTNVGRKRPVARNVLSTCSGEGGISFVFQDIVHGDHGGEESSQSRSPTGDFVGILPKIDEETNAFRFFEYSPAVRDVNRYPVFQCLTATRTSYKPEIPMVTYDWSLNGGEGQERKHLFVTYTPAATIDTAFYTLEFDGETINNKNPARLLYLNDDEGCSILQISVFGYQCILWVSDNIKDNISEECLAEYDKVCGTGFSIYDKKTCNDTAP